MIKGFQSISFIDVPNHVASVVFVGGCNFKCPWCHNKILLDQNNSNLPVYTNDEIFEKLLKRKKICDSVCISGGEPTLWDDWLLNFIENCKRFDLFVKLDTNGYRPDILEKIIKEDCIDMIAMDIKNIFDKYNATIGIDIDIHKIQKSIDILKKAQCDVIFRCTLVPNMVNLNEMKVFAQELGVKIIFQDYKKK